MIGGEIKVEVCVNSAANSSVRKTLDTCKSLHPAGFDLRISRLQDRHANLYIYTTAAYTTEQC